MSSTFLSGSIWPEITKAVKRSKGPCYAAVAYFASEGPKLLPLPRNSVLVVDASEPTVKSGRTNPEALLKLINRGVRVFTAPSLHAKVIVTARRAFVGSTNASSLSANGLIEAVVSTTEIRAVAAARRFVQENCFQQLTPKLTKYLCAIYEPPRIPAGRRTLKQTKAPISPPAPLRLAQLHFQEWSASDQKAHDSAHAIAKKRRKHPDTYKLDFFRLIGRCRYERGDVVLQILNEGKNRIYISPPGNVVHTTSRKTKRGQVSFVYIEIPKQKRRRLKVFAKQLGRGALKKLGRDGLVQNHQFAKSLLTAWHAP